MRIGVQVSIAGSVDSSIDRAKALGCNTMQIFARNPRSFRKSALRDDEVDLFKRKIKDAKIKPVIIHIPYTINLAASIDSFGKVSVREFTADLLEADRLGAEFLVTHMGSCKGEFERKGLSRFTAAMEKILADTQGGNTVVLLENTTGNGHNLGYKFAHHRVVMESLGWPERLGVCVDTAHLWGAGYRIDNPEGLALWLDEVEKEVGIKRIKVIHLNDTKEVLGSRNDRHCPIGEGNIGKKGFSYFFSHPYLKKLPYILETPRVDQEDDLKNLAVAKEIYENTNTH